MKEAAFEMGEWVSEWVSEWARGESVVEFVGFAARLSLKSPHLSLFNTLHVEGKGE